MQVILSVNCPDFECVKKRLEQIGEIGESIWAHFDVSDGRFSPYLSWGAQKEEILQLKSYGLLKLNFEVHLMVENPGEFVAEWARAGARRVIAHLEAVREKGFGAEGLGISGCEMGLAMSPDTPVRELEPYLKDIKFIQILAVRPGPAGQKFDESVLDKIRFLKEKYPDVRIEVDGGINLETAKMVKDAGADIIVSASYIFNSSNPRQKYEELNSI